MTHRERPVDQTSSDSLKSMVEEASRMQPQDESFTPRHRGDRTAQVEPMPTLASRPADMPAPLRSIDSSPLRGLDPGSIVFSPDPGRYRRQVVGDPNEHRVGFRSTREVIAEMSPVIYRPASSGGNEPEKPPRVSIAGPGVPTAASFAKDEAPTKRARGKSKSRWVEVDLDEDPDIDDDELVGEAEDHLIDDDLGHRDDAATPEEPAATSQPVPVSPPASTAPVLRRRRRILGRAEDSSESDALAPTAAEPAHLTDEQDTAAQDAVEQDEAEQGEAPTAADSVAAPRPRRVRTLHIGAPPVGPATDEPADQPAADQPAVDEPMPEQPEESIAEPANEPVVEPPAATASPVPAAHDPRWRQAAPPRLGSPVRPPVATEPAEATAAPVEDQLLAEDPMESAPEAEAEAQAEEAPSADDGAPRVRDAAAISGRVLSSRGRGLSGIAIVAVDADDRVVGTATSGRHGEYAVEDLTDGSYRIGARDMVNGDFIDSWHGGDDADGATEVRIVDDRTARDVDVTLIGRVTIEAAVDVRRKKAVIEVEVVDRSTGLPCDGTVIIGTDHFRTRLPLTKGNTTITVFASGRDHDADDRFDPQVTIEYPGSPHTGAGSRVVQVR